MEGMINYGMKRKDAKEKMKELLSMVELEETYAARFPHEVSGGQCQRAAIARALATQPKILLLDEPFGALDALTKIELQEELLKIRSRCGNTMIMVTHDIEEAIFLADRIVVMSARPGRIRDVIQVELGKYRDRGGSDFGTL